MGSVEYQSNLFELENLSQSDPPGKMHIPHSFRLYNPKLAAHLRQLYPEIRLQHSAFENSMWLLLAGEAPSIVVPWIMNGDNLEKALTDIFCLHVLTQEHESFGPNVENLSILVPFADFRQDKPSSKPLPEEMTTGKKDEIALVTAQASWTLPLARWMKSVGVDTLVTVDGHSFTASEQFRSEGINVINITTAKLMIEYLRETELLSDDLDTIVVGVDLGNLALAHKLAKEEGFKIGIMHKRRIAIGNGEKSRTEHELVYGDVQGRKVVLMDDMIGSGGTMLNTVEYLVDKGAAEIIACASHAVFAGREYYDKLRQILRYDEVKQVLVSDTLPLSRPIRGADRDLPYIFKKTAGVKEKKELEILSVNDFLAYITGVMLWHTTAEEIEVQMEEHVLRQVNPYELYKKITGKKIAEPKVVAQYKEGGEFVMLQ